MNRTGFTRRHKIRELKRLYRLIAMAVLLLGFIAASARFSKMRLPIWQPGIVSSAEANGLSDGCLLFVLPDF